MGEQIPLKWLKFEQAVTGLVGAGTNFTALDVVSNYYHTIVVLVRAILIPFYPNSLTGIQIQKGGCMLLTFQPLCPVLINRFDLDFIEHTYSGDINGRTA